MAPVSFQSVSHFFSVMLPVKIKCVARARHGDVKQPQFLARLLAALMLLREPVRQARITPSGLRRLHARAKAEFLVKNNFAAQILLVEIFRQVGDGDDGKFQAFALVNAHQAHGIFLRDRRDFRLGFDFALRLDEFQKAEQALPLKLVEFFREVQKSPDVRVPLRAARARFEPVVVMRFRQNCSRHCESEDCCASFRQR